MLWLVASADAARWVRDANRGATLSSHLTSLGLGFLIYRMRSPTAWSLRVGPGRCACACAHACAYARVHMCVCTRACGGQGSHTPEARSLFVTTSSPEPPLLSPPDSGTAAGPPLLQLLPARHRLDTSHGRPLTGGLSSPLTGGAGEACPRILSPSQPGRAPAGGAGGAGPPRLCLCPPPGVLGPRTCCSSIFARCCWVRSWAFGAFGAGGACSGASCGRSASAARSCHCWAWACPGSAVWTWGRAWAPYSCPLAFGADVPLPSPQLAHWSLLGRGPQPRSDERTTASSWPRPPRWASRVGSRRF